MEDQNFPVVFTSKGKKYTWKDGKEYLLFEASKRTSSGELQEGWVAITTYVDPWEAEAGVKAKLVRVYRARARKKR